MLVLQVLAVEPMHGYKIVQQIKRRTSEQLTFGEGCIYPILHRLESEGKLSSDEVEMRGRKRLVYALTENGKALLVEKVSQWESIVNSIQTVLEGGHDEPATMAS